MQIKMLAILLFCKVKCLLLIFYNLSKGNALRVYLVRLPLAHAIGEGIGAYPSYKAAPSFPFTIGDYTLDRNGVLTGPRNSKLMLTLDQGG